MVPFSSSGTADFVPKVVKHGDLFSKTVCETVAETMDKANAWISKQDSIRITNIQTVNFKVKRDLGKLVIVR